MSLLRGREYNQPVEVTVLFFATLRSLAGSRQIAMTLPEECSVGALYATLADRYPGLEARRQQLIIAVNGEARPDTHILAAGDEVALLPPVSGGAR